MDSNGSFVLFFSPFRLFYALAEFNLSLMSAPLRFVGSSSANGESTLVAERPIESSTKPALEGRDDVPMQSKAPPAPAVATVSPALKAEAATSHAVSAVIASVTPAQAKPVATAAPVAAVARVTSPPTPRSVAEAVRAVAPAPVLRPSVPSKTVGSAPQAKSASAKSPVTPPKATKKKKKR